MLHVKYGPVLLEIDISSIYNRLIKSSNLEMLLHTTIHLYTHPYLIYFQQHNIINKTTCSNNNLTRFLRLQILNSK